MGQLRHLALLLLVSCATVTPAPAPQPEGETQEEAWRRARHIEAMVNGCVRDCPDPDVRCVDDYGLCWSPCAWAKSDEATRASLHMAALEMDPTSTFFIDCPAPPRGTLEARHHD